MQDAVMGRRYVSIGSSEASQSFRSVFEFCGRDPRGIHEDSSSVPSYPAHVMRYCNLHLYHQSSLELRNSEISYFGLPLTLTGGRNSWRWLGMVFRVDGSRTET